MTLKTPTQKKREAKDMVIYGEFKELSANPDNAISAINEYLMKKYRLKSASTIWQIRKRVEARLAKNIA